MQQEHPWGLATAQALRRDRASSRSGYDDEAAGALEQAAAGYDALGLRFDAGEVAARTRSRAASASEVGRSAASRSRRRQAVFDELGSAGLGRGGPRRARPRRRSPAAAERRAHARPSSGSPSWRRDGLANKEIAQALLLSVNTVEGHLSHVYAKLGVRSRAQLARRLSGAG